MFKIMTPVGTRPELINMSRTIAEFDKQSNHILRRLGRVTIWSLGLIIAYLPLVVLARVFHTSEKKSDQAQMFGSYWCKMTVVRE